MTIRAKWTSYLVLMGIWILLAIGYLFLSIRNPGRGLESGSLIAGGIAILWWIWLRGFKINISDGCLEYRDGFFRSSKISLREIVDIKTESIGWNLLGQKFRIPRLSVINSNREIAMRINPKPFGRHSLQRIIKELRKV